MSKFLVHDRLSSVIQNSKANILGVIVRRRILGPARIKREVAFIFHRIFRHDALSGIRRQLGSAPARRDVRRKLPGGPEIGQPYLERYQEPVTRINPGGNHLVAPRTCLARCVGIATDGGSPPTHASRMLALDEVDLLGGETGHL
jgi:hypothetical protein